MPSRELSLEVEIIGGILTLTLIFVVVLAMLKVKHQADLPFGLVLLLPEADDACGAAVGMQVEEECPLEAVGLGGNGKPANIIAFVGVAEYELVVETSKLIEA